MDSCEKVATHQRRALDFMLDALGLQHVRENAHRVVRLLELEQQVPTLVRENHQLRRRVVELEHALSPDDTELDALAREAEGRVARASDRSANEI
jgi:hypothetical protein